MYTDYALIKKSTLTEIGDAIRNKKETTALIKPSDFGSEILSIESGGGGGYMVVVTILSGANDLERGTTAAGNAGNSTDASVIYRLRTKGYIDVEENHLYKIVFSSTKNILVCVIFYDKNDFASPSIDDSVPYSQSGVEFTTPSGCKYIRLLFKYADAEYTPMTASEIGYVAISMAR